jgi:hypothetical protein
MKMICFSVLLTLTLYADIIHVPADQPTIQEGLDAAQENDTVLVSAGTYYENIVWPQIHGIDLIAAAPPESVIIDGNQSGHVIYITMYDTTNAICGFTIQNGLAGYGAGIYCYTSSPSIYGNIITANSASNVGGGLYCCNCSSPKVIDNLFENNEADSGAAMYFIFDCWPIVLNNTFAYNAADIGGAIASIYYGNNLQIESNTFIANTATSRGGALYGAWPCSLHVVNNVFEDNVADSSGGTIYCGPDASLTLLSNSIRDNSARAVGGVYFHRSRSGSMHYNDFENNGYAAWNSDSTVVIDAVDNWWGHASGPYHPTLNPGGLGDTVSDYVDFIPWATEPGIEENGSQPGEIVQESPLRGHPNPFLGQTQLRYHLIENSTVSLEIYDVTGRRVRSIDCGRQIAGDHSAPWDGTDDSGLPVPPGIYFVRSRSSNSGDVARVVRIR